MAPIIRIDDDDRETLTPEALTALGNRLSTWLTLDCTSFCASTGSTLSSKVSEIEAEPSRDELSMYKRPSSPVIASSSTAVTEFSTAVAVAPE